MYTYNILVVYTYRTVARITVFSRRQCLNCGRYLLLHPLRSCTARITMYIARTHIIYTLSRLYTRFRYRAVVILIDFVPPSPRCHHRSHRRQCCRRCNFILIPTESGGGLVKKKNSFDSRSPDLQQYSCKRHICGRLSSDCFFTFFYSFPLYTVKNLV
jgi:hypothetical protein